MPPTASRHVFPDLSSADWFRVRLHHHLAQFLREEGVAEPDDLPRAAKASLVGFVAPYILTPDQLAAIKKANPGQAEPIARNRAVWEAALAMGPSRIRPGETEGAPLKRHHPDPGLAVACDRGAEDLRTGAWRAGRSLWFLMSYAVARDRGIPVETPPAFAALDARTRTALSWMHRTILSGDRNLDLTAGAIDGEDPESPAAGTGMILAEWIYPFQSSAGYLLMDWTMPDPLPTGARPVSRHCPCDTALRLLRAARDHAVGPPNRAANDPAACVAFAPRPLLSGARPRPLRRFQIAHVETAGGGHTTNAHENAVRATRGSFGEAALQQQVGP